MSKIKPLLHIKLLSIFPEMFPAQLSHSLAGKALEKNIWGYEAINIRDYAKDKHKSVDDANYGGGTGMVMRPDVIGEAIENNIDLKKDGPIIYPSPRGELFNQKLASDLIKKGNFNILCGRFEGLDQRAIDEYNIQEVSIGDYILSGGEIAAIVIMDACIRLLEGVINNKEALFEESFGENADYTGLLEYPLYTRPLKWKNHEVPEILTSGNHGEIERWRLERAREITKQRRPDLWKKYKDA